MAPTGIWYSDVDLVNGDGAAWRPGAGARERVRMDVVSAHEEAALRLYAKRRRVRFARLLSPNGCERHDRNRRQREATFNHRRPVSLRPSVGLLTTYFVLRIQVDPSVRRGSRIAELTAKEQTAAALVGMALAVAIGLAAQAPPPPPFGAIGPLPAPAPAATFDVFEKSIVDLLAAQRIGTVTSRDLVEKYLARIRAYDQDGPRLNAMIALNPRALEEADALDAERRAGRVRGPLHGIPIVVKDNYATADMPTTAGSLALGGFQTGRDAFMVKRLKRRRRGHHRQDQPARARVRHHHRSARPAARRATRTTRRAIPGGSSGGTGAAVAASFAAAGMGTDTCGSIRNPASENSLFGLRGTVGLSSRDGIVPLAHSQDIGGPLARTVTDLAPDARLHGRLRRRRRDHARERGPHSAHLQRVGRRCRPGRCDDRRADAAVRHGARRRGSRRGSCAMRSKICARSAPASSKSPFPGLDELLQNTSVINAEFKFDLLDFLAKYPAAPVHSLGEILIERQVPSGGRERAETRRAR